MSNTLRLVLCLALPLLVGSLSGIATSQGVNGWYDTLQKPSFNPPNYLFGPVWTVLYLLLGYSFYLLLNQPESDWRTKAALWFSVQLFLNFCWSFIFFKYHNLFAALIDILLLWCTIAAMIFSMIKVKPVIGYLQIPYLLWVSFASVLNAAIWWLNR